jgi:hypothetical protein
VGASDGDGTIDAGLKGAPLKLSHMIQDDSDVGRKQAHLQWLRQPKVMADQVGGEVLVPYATLSFYRASFTSVSSF